MTKTRTATILAATLIALTACSSDDNRPRRTNSTGGGPNIEEPSPTTEQPALGPLTVGDTYTWPHDQVAATVTSVAEFTNLGEYDTVEPGEIPFRVEITVTNNGQQPIDASSFSAFVMGATVGGEAAGTSFDEGSNEFAGQLAPGNTATFTDDAVIDEQYGRDVLVELQRWDTDVMDEPPVWTATIE